MRKELMKKYVVGILMLTLAVVCIGCGNTSKESENTQNEQQTENVNDEETKEDSLVKNEISAERVENASVTDASAFEYERIDGGISITNYVGDSEIVVIPEEIDGGKVVLIGESSFLNNKTIKGLKMPDTVQIVAKNAFCNCYELQVVICGKELQSIEECAFNFCQALHTIELNENLKTLGLASFTYAKSLQQIYIPRSVQSIEGAFSGLNDTLTIIAEAGSVAEQYAKEAKIPFKTK